jgi:hypothetical protein
MERLDLSFLNPEPAEAVRERDRDALEEADPTALPPATGKELQPIQKSQSGSSDVEVSPWPRTHGEWQVLLAERKKEKESTWRVFDRQRGIDLAYRMQSAKIETIKAARAEIPVLGKRIASIKRKLAFWGWCPFRKVTLLPCHIGYRVGAIGRQKRLWTKRQSDHYFQLLLSILLEQLSSAEHVASLQPCKRYQNGKYVFCDEYLAAEAKFNTANLAYRAALKQAEDFNRNGPPVESPDAEVGRRLAKYEAGSYGCELGRIEQDPKHSISGLSGTARSHRPQVHIGSPKC